MTPTEKSLADEGSEAIRTASAVTWPTEDRDIAEVIASIRDPNAPPASADRILRSLLALAKTAAFGAGTLHGFRLGEKLAQSIVRAREPKRERADA